MPILELSGVYVLTSRIIADIRSNMVQIWSSQGCTIIECIVGIDEVSNVCTK